MRTKINQNKFMSIFNRRDEKFTEFLKRYWWIEFFVIIKVIYFVNKEFYNFFIGFLILIAGLIVLWVLYRLGLK